MEAKGKKLQEKTLGLEQELEKWQTFKKSL